MKQDVLLQLTEQWGQMTQLVLDLKRIPSEQLQSLLKETYKILSLYCKDNLVPKDVCKILLEMDAFLYFASIVEGKEVEINFHFYQAIHMMVEALKEGFFRGKYECDYPMLMFHDATGNSHVLDLENTRKPNGLDGDFGEFIVNSGRIN